MKIHNIEFPDEIFEAIGKEKLVIFAGAGVSMGAPAGLPDFKCLAREIAVKHESDYVHKGVTLSELFEEKSIENIFQFLYDEVGRDEIRQSVAEALKYRKQKPTELHQALLRIFETPDCVRVITTNFDLLFEQAANSVFGDCDSKLASYSLPTLPLAESFKGVVHVHGTICDALNMVIASEDFGRAYMTKEDGRARRFLVEILRNSTVLFVGYSHNDPIMLYMSRGLKGSTEDRHFALTPFDGIGIWNDLGITPIKYPKRNDHKLLTIGVQELADIICRDQNKLKKRVAYFAKSEPPEEELHRNIIEYALAQDTDHYDIAEHFTEVAKSPKWISWLDNRNIFDKLFSAESSITKDNPYVTWLIEKFASKHSKEIFKLIHSRDTQPHQIFWQSLVKEVGSFSAEEVSNETFNEWVRILIESVPKIFKVNEKQKTCDELLEIGDDLLKVGECCEARLMSENLLLVFDALVKVSSRFDMNYTKIGHSLLSYWKDYLQNNTDEIAETVLLHLLHHFRDQYFLQKWNTKKEQFSATRSYSQFVRFTISVQKIIAFECLGQLVEQSSGKVKSLIDELPNPQNILLRSLVLDFLRSSEYLTADKKIDHLLNIIDDIYDRTIEPEVLELFSSVYFQADNDHQEIVISKITDYIYYNQANSNLNELTAQQKFKWLKFIQNSSLENYSLIKPYLNEVKSELYKFAKKYFSEQKNWEFREREISQKIEKLEDMLAMSSFELLLAYSSTPINEQYKLNELMCEFAKHDADKFMELTNELIERAHWDSRIWGDILDAWSEMNRDSKRDSTFLSLMKKQEMQSKQSYAISFALFNVIKHYDNSSIDNFLDELNEVALPLWDNQIKTVLDERSQISIFLLDDSGAFDFLSNEHIWLSTAQNHTVGILTEFWILGYHRWCQQHRSLPDKLDGPNKEALIFITSDNTKRGELCKIILAWNITFFLKADKEWAKKHLVPMFIPEPGNVYRLDNNAELTWYGFLRYNKSIPLLLPELQNACLRMASQIKYATPEIRMSFISYYIAMANHMIDKQLS